MLLTDFHRETTSVSEVAGPVPFDEAVRRVLCTAKPLGGERISLLDADDRTLAAPAIAQRSAPLAVVSAMDGFAVRDADVTTLPARLAVVGKSFAGKPYTGSMGHGVCVRIFTGAALPPEADRITIQEDATVENSTAIIASPTGTRRQVRAAGSDFHYGQIVVAAGRRLRPRDLIAAAAADLGEGEVFRRPRVRILCCGDEMVPPGTAWDSADNIPKSISVGIAALIHRSGGLVTGRALIPDALDAIRATARGALQSSDIVATIGGASAGERDFAKAAFASFGLTRLFDKVAIKPGKPVWLGEARGIPVVGLPGNPASALVTARLLLAPLIAGLAGRDSLESLKWRTVRFDGDIERSSDRDVFVWARSVDGRIRLLTSPGSADQKALAAADILVRFRLEPCLDPSMEALVEIVDL